MIVGTATAMKYGAIAFKSFVLPGASSRTLANPKRAFASISLTPAILVRQGQLLPSAILPSSLSPSTIATPGRLVACRQPCSPPQWHRGLASSSTIGSDTTSENENDGATGDDSRNYSKHIRSYHTHYINGKWTRSSNKNTSTIDVIDSNNGRAVATVPRGTEDVTLRAIEAAKNALPMWSRQTTPNERLNCIKVFLERFQSEHRIDEMVDRLSVELGCTRALARNAQIMAPVYTTQALLDLLDNDGSRDGNPSFEWEYSAGNCTVVKEPIGVVGAITPWNYPLHQIAIKVIPALVAGCTIVLKPSEVTPLTAYSFAEAIDEAGFPEGVFNMVLGEGSYCGEILASHPSVDLVSFTGSTKVGQILTKVAANSGTMKAVRTELGGKSAAVLLDDADYARVVPAFVKQLTSNTGQSCNALSRMLVSRDHCDRVLEIATKTMEKELVGCGATNPNATIGPLASETQYNSVRSYIESGIREGARVVTGGLEMPEGTETSGGYFVRPTMFADVTNDMTIARDEIFGPVLCVIPYDTEDEAIALANDTPYGLNNAVASEDLKRALGVASKLESGAVGRILQ
jgi:aldehyde dehydrogenase (NAD+)